MNPIVLQEFFIVNTPKGPKPFSWLTNASKPFTDKCFLKKSYFQADDPGLFPQRLKSFGLCAIVGRRREK
jgi:hypothetical protein